MTMTPLRRRGAALTAALLGSALVLSACGSDGDADDATGETRSVEADNGTVEVPVDPQRVAVLGNAVLPYLDLGGEPIAVTDLDSSALADLPSDQRAAYDAATNVGVNGGEADYEKLAKLEPDLIVIAVPESDYEKLEDKLTSIAPTVHLGFDSDWKFRATALAEATGETDAFDEQKASYDDVVTRIQQEHGDTLKTAKITEAYRWESEDAGKFSINGSLCAEVVRDEGIVDFAPAEFSVSFEQIGSLAESDLILYPAAIDGQPSEAIVPVLETNSWKALPAVTSGRAQGIYCPWGRSFGFAAQYLEGLERALATLETEQ
ncbi:ABC transporter substrate-binding protein [Nocardioides humi]|uniref:Fe/B12 periplasmic-binding domain-containing protein n=1 Tax=Nocardioides humi TaxID=449461 RepID=A0ABN1ZR74_9ACTN|nr:ABC transporter substrate-binding protein [Nocardioides humi]